MTLNFIAVRVIHRIKVFEHSMVPFHLTLQCYNRSVLIRGKVGQFDHKTLCRKPSLHPKIAFTHNITQSGQLLTAIVLVYANHTTRSPDLQTCKAKFVRSKILCLLPIRSQLTTVFPVSAEQMTTNCSNFCHHT